MPAMTAILLIEGATIPAHIHPMWEEVRRARAAEVPIVFEEMPRYVAMLIAQARFPPSADWQVGMAVASRISSNSQSVTGPIKEVLRLKWRVDPSRPGSSLLGWIVETEGHAAHGPLSASGMNDVGQALFPAAETYSRMMERGRWRQDPVVAPGGALEEKWEGHIRDYGGCARANELCRPDWPCDLSRGTLPLGRWAFGRPPALAQGEMPAVTHGTELFLGRDATGRPLEFKGTLICAPPGAGKTELILRWAETAIRHDYSLLMVDVKGNMRDKLARRLARHGRPESCAIYHFSTDHHEPDFDRLNFLAGFSVNTADGVQECINLTDAILPKKGLQEGEQALYYGNRVDWLSGLIGLVKLHELHCKFKDREHDLSDVCWLANDERNLVKWIEEIDAAEFKAPKDKPPVTSWGLDFWFSRISSLLEAVDIPRQNPEQMSLRGQRNPKHPYVDYTHSILVALRPFERGGLLCERIQCPLSGSNAHRQFRLEDLDGERQVAIVLSVPGEGSPTANAVLAVVIGRVERLLRNRFKGKNRRPVFLLLDETTRIAGFDALNYVSFSRESEVGVVLVYQFLKLIGEKAQQLLGIVGTQIYLKSIPGDSFPFFTAQFGKRPRKRATRSVTGGTGGTSESIQITEEQVDYLEQAAVVDLPAGAYPALVFIREHPCDKPFLVDLDEGPAPAGSPSQFAATVTELCGHTDAVCDLAFTRDGARLLSASKDETARLWSLADGSATRVLEGHVREIRSVAISPDEKMAATGSWDATVRLWSLPDGRELHKFKVPRGNLLPLVNTVAFSPDGALLVCGCDDATVHLWHTADGSPTRVLKGHDQNVVRVVFAPDGLVLASASWDGTVKIWRVGDGALLSTIRPSDDQGIQLGEIAFSPDGRQLVTGPKDFCVRLWNVADAAPAAQLEGDHSPKTCLAFAPHGQLLAAGDSDGNIRLWNLPGGRLQATLGDGTGPGEPPAVTQVAFSPDGRLLAGGYQNGAVRVWEVIADKLLLTLTGHQGPVARLAWRLDGKRLASAAEDATVRLWDFPD